MRMTPVALMKSVTQWSMKRLRVTPSLSWPLRLRSVSVIDAAPDTAQLNTGSKEEEVVISSSAMSAPSLAKKNAESLARWIAWREWYPEAVWSGERNREAVVAKPPSSKPMVYARQNGGHRPAPPPPDDDINPDGEIPFITNVTDEEGERWWRF